MNFLGSQADPPEVELCLSPSQVSRLSVVPSSAVYDEEAEADGAQENCPQVFCSVEEKFGKQAILITRYNFFTHTHKTIIVAKVTGSSYRR